MWESSWLQRSPLHLAGPGRVLQSTVHSMPSVCLGTAYPRIGEYHESDSHICPGGQGTHTFHRTRGFQGLVGAVGVARCISVFTCLLSTLNPASRRVCVTNMGVSEAFPKWHTGV